MSQHSAVRSGAPEAERAVPALERARSAASISVTADADGVVRLGRLGQSGSAKLRLPRVHGPAPEAVLINTAGGLAGGDRLRFDADVGPGAQLILSTQTAERVYRPRPEDPAAEVDLALRVGAGAGLAWLPQETIFFEGARLRRRLEADMAEDAELWLLEAQVYGRRAMGEQVRTGAVSDHWRIRRGGALTHAEAFRLSEPTATLAAPATALGGEALATLVWLSPCAEAALDAAREALAPWLGPEALGIRGARAGVSAWDGRLAVRAVAKDGASLRRLISGFLLAFEPGSLPRVWSL